MRRALLALALLAALPAQAATLSVPDVQYVFVEATTPDRWSYISIPTGPRERDVVKVWRIDVFRDMWSDKATATTPAYSAAEFAYDCRVRRLQRLRGAIFSPKGDILYSTEQAEPWGPTPDDDGQGMINMACGEYDSGHDRLRGLEGILDNAERLARPGFEI